MVSDFQSETSDPSLSAPTFKVWARKDAIKQASYAKDIGPKILTYFEEYYDIDFPLPKVDMVALPDFNAGLQKLIIVSYTIATHLFFLFQHSRKF